MSVVDIALGEVVGAVISGLIRRPPFSWCSPPLGFVVSPWALLALPASVLIGFAFAAAGLAVTTYHARLLRPPADPARHAADVPVRDDVLPADHLSGAARPFVEALPLYQSTELLREPALGHVGWGLAGNAAYLLAMGVFALWLATRRMARALLH